MENQFVIVLRHAPYGRIDAAEAVRHLTGAHANRLAATLLLLDDGVYLAKTGQVATAGWTNLAATLEGTIREGDAGAPTVRIRVCAHAAALAERGLTQQDLVPGCTVIDDAGIADVVAAAKATLVY